MEINFIDPLPEENWSAIGWVPNFVDRHSDYEIVWMSPETFMSFVDPNFKPGVAAFQSKSLNWLEEQAHAGAKFAPLQVWATKSDTEALKRGIVLPPPAVVRDHEGRHRAWLAYNLGMEEIPVAVWRRAGNPRRRAKPKTKAKANVGSLVSKALR